MNRRCAALAAASGLLLVVIFPKFNFHLLAWIALVPLFLALRGQSTKNGFWLGGITGIVYFAGTVHWVTNSIHYYGGYPLIPASLITLLLCAYLALYPALFGAAVARLRRTHPSLLVLSAPAVWATLELARTYVFSGFPWSLLGYSQYLALPVIQVSDITGVYGISFLIVLVNAAVAEFLDDRKGYPPLVIAAVIMVLVLGYGLMRLHVPENISGITVSVVQGNIEQDKKWDPTFQTEVLAVYTRLTQDALQHHPDVVIWPETATPFYFNGERPRDRSLREDLTSFVKENDFPLLFGSPTCEIRPGRVVHLRNSAFLLKTDGTVEAVYHKLHLVPFGEYVPLKNVLFFVEKMVQPVGDFEAGKDYTVMTIAPHGPGSTNEVKLSTAICYEIIFPDLIRRFVDRGATIITTITNDAWFGMTAAPYQHFSMAVFRAVENRVPVARAANTGVSGFIDAKGRILDTSTIFTEAQLTRTLALRGAKTFYTRYGDVFSYLCLFSSIFLLAKPLRRIP
ncbi:MAG TPA: apolipoprotein N-acyltransferase [Nitrospirota bacterium]|nr:apolipoprotein N-acyltransferase [Nitrospirota bacterium]